MPPDHPAARQGEDRRAELIRAAIEVFGEAGYAGARIDEVARRVGIRRPSVLYHFPDKQSLYLASISDVVQDISNRVLATESEPTGERLEAISDAWVDFVIERPNAARLLLRQMIDATPLPIPDSDLPVGRLFESIQDAINEQTPSDAGKTLDASEFSLILSSTSLVWVAGRSAVKGALGFDTLAPQSIQRHRRTLHSLVRQLLVASNDATNSLIPEHPVPRGSHSPSNLHAHADTHADTQAEIHADIYADIDPEPRADSTPRVRPETRETIPSSKRST